MSTTTQEQTPESSPQMPQMSASAKVDKKKLKILKQALKDERANRSQIEKEMEAAKEVIGALKNVISEKEQKYLQLY